MTFRNKKKVEYVNITEIVNAVDWCYKSCENKHITKVFSQDE